jgi:hypothetical protein
VDVIIKGTSATLQELARQAQGDESDAKILRKIAQNVLQSKTIKTNYGHDVMALIEKFGLPDVKIIEAHYRGQPREDNRKWIDVIPYYRGIVMHHSYFDFRKNHDIDDVVCILRHPQASSGIYMIYCSGSSLVY